MCGEFNLHACPQSSYMHLVCPPSSWMRSALALRDLLLSDRGCAPHLRYLISFRLIMDVFALALPDVVACDRECI